MTTNLKTILYVDDDQDDLVLFRQAVNDLSRDHHIIEAFDGMHALELLEQMKQSSQHLPCLIVLDINMPRMDGKQTLVAIQNTPAFSAIPVVLFSTSSNKLDKALSEQRRVELVTKPFEHKGLYQTVSRLLSHYAA
jgi:CheY-like chemotaxis protein